MKYILIVLFGLALTLSACNKNELPKPIEEQPQVWLAGSINGNPFDIKAGVNAVYASSYTHTFDSIFREFIFKIDLTGSKEALIFNLYDSFTNYTNPKDILDHSIQPNTYRYTYSNVQNFNFAAKDIIVRYVNYGASQTYYSYQYFQSPSASFKIISVKDIVFEGKPFKLAEVSFNCKLKCPLNGWLINITDAHGFIPFGQQ
jgi:hypothetical protein